jgi:nucleoside-diphosphate-sugar epimerase
MNILIIGGTRNMGYFLAEKLSRAGHRLTVLNRGISRDELSEDIARLRCDRTDPQQMRRALSGRQFDVVIDTVLYNETEAEAVVDLLDGQIGHYICLSTGQVYLVRDGIERPFKEEDYHGPLMPPPEANTYDYEEWLYGMDKRAAEDVLATAYETRGFPYTALRMPMVNSERDGFHRLYGYMLRIQDGGPILVPDRPNYPIRNVYSADVVTTIIRLIETGSGKGRAYNIAQDETVSLEELLEILGELIGIEPQIVTVERDLLEANGFLPDCSPFSDRWMSELDNTRSKSELGITYTPLRTYLGKIVAHYRSNPPQQPTSYRRRHAERSLMTE